ncbi:hypothetical protein [Nocardioides marmoraquaticus]
MRRVGTAVALVGALALTACQAPLEPESRRTAETVEAAPEQEPTPTSAAPSPTPRKAQRPAVPDVTVPEGIEDVEPMSGPVIGGDVSWPQCPPGLGIPEKRTLGMPMPVPAAKFVVIGLTNGPGFTVNPCIADQLAWVEQRQLLVAAYAVLSSPYGDQLTRYGGKGPYDGGTPLGAMRNVGYQQARATIATMQRIGFRTPIVWLDVEPVPSFDWSGDQAANAAVVEGAARGYTDAGYQVGVYSTAYMWAEVVGGFSLGVPEWRAAGQTSQAEATRRCGPDRVIQGGQAVMSQWVMDSRDFNITCPGTSSRMTDWFFQT